MINKYNYITKQYLRQYLRRGFVKFVILLCVCIPPKTSRKTINLFLQYRHRSHTLIHKKTTHFLTSLINSNRIYV